jgi:hypothetical protein
MANRAETAQGPKGTVPSAPGVTHDTSPRFWCCTATKVAVWELAANAAASGPSLTVVPAREPSVSVWELVDFIEGRLASAFLFPNLN